MYQLYVKRLSKQDAETYMSALSAPQGVTFDPIRHDWYGSPYLPVQTEVFSDAGLKRELKALINVPFLILKKLSTTQPLDLIELAT